MNPKYLAQAIRELSPGIEFSFNDSDLSTLVIDNDKKRPNDADVLTKAAELKAIAEATEAAKPAQREALLAKLGITAEEAALLLG
jgi:hypothetical protein